MRRPLGFGAGASSGMETAAEDRLIGEAQKAESRKPESLSYDGHPPDV
jgi:hypothetical protein